MAISVRAPLVALLAIHLAAAPVIAQTTVRATDALDWRTLGERLKPYTLLEITTTAGETVTGHLLSASDSAFVLIMPDRPELPYPQSKTPNRKVDFSDIQSVTYHGGLNNRGARVAAGAVIIGGIGVVVGVLLWAFTHQQ